MRDERAERAKRETLRKRLHHSLTNHPPISPEVIVAYESIRVKAKELGDLIVDACPLGREQSLALTHLEEVVMWAVKAIVVDQENVIERLGPS
jgi:hypothetical protein